MVMGWLPAARVGSARRVPMMYRWLLKPLLFLMSAESAHHLAFWLLRSAHRIPLVRSALSALFGVTEPALRVRALGRELPSPIVLAAGFDKNAAGFEALLGIGFGA